MAKLHFSLARHALIIIAVTMICQAAAQGQTTTVQLGCATPQFAHVFDNPLKTLATATARDTKSARFRVTWGGSLGSAWNQGTMFFDRKRNLLKYYDVGGAGEAGEWYYRKSYLFTGIKDKTLGNFVKIYNNEQNIHKLYPSSFINLLPEHGYRRYKIADVEINRKFKRKPGA